ncbi:hypothetical protein MMC16_001111 [Acarospora aff. strigata]|nr:hypothetical protein [Acarospora aff. strigata]
MPSTQKVGSPGPNNDKIGGVPTIHYFDFQSRGRGQVVRLLWEVRSSLSAFNTFLDLHLHRPEKREEQSDNPSPFAFTNTIHATQDAGIAYEDIRYSFDEFPEVKKTKISELNPTGNIPVIELNGKILTQSYAILRHFARQLGQYEGQTEDEKYWADAMCDVASDWRTLFIIAFFNPNKDQTYPAHQSGDRNRFLGALETHLKSNELSQKGPFVVGKNITYADLVIYQICHDENLTQDGRAGLKDYPRLKQLIDGVEGRENVAAFLKSERYLG